MPNTLTHGPFEDRFWRGVPETAGLPSECWNWQRYVCPVSGYGRLSGPDGNQKIGAHRAAWLVVYGPIPDGMSVLHKCDNRGCVNPSHLFLGTHADNMRDMKEKGRRKLPNRLSAADVRRRQQSYYLRNKKCCRGHELPPYVPGPRRRRVCMEPVCVEARKELRERSKLARCGQ